jgi:hypothetical protein
MLRTIDLNGTWTVSYGDVQDRPVQVPGAVEAVMEDRTHPGPFLYKRSVFIDEKEDQAAYVLRFGGVSYYCEVYCNGVLIQTHEGIWDAFQADATEAIRPGENRIEVKVIKPDFDKDSPYYFRSVLFGFIPDVMLPFGGLWRAVSLEVKGRTHFESAVCRFDTMNRQVVIHSRLNRPDPSAVLEAEITDPDGKRSTHTLPYSERVQLDLDDIRMWSPEAPQLYRVDVRLLRDGAMADRCAWRGGFRRIEIRGGEILLNGEPFYMRGILHWGSYPDRMTPTPSYEQVKEELRKLRAAGFNAVKHCLYFPPSYYYELCDEMGIVTWQELPLWLPYNNPHLLERIYAQYPKMLDQFMHHPGVSLVSLGCELDTTISADTLNALYRMVKEREPQMIICDNSGSGECYEGVSNASSDIYDYHFYAELYHLDTLINEFTRSYREVKPWLFGEYNDADTFRLLHNRERADTTWWLHPDERVNLLRLVHKGFGSDQPVYRQDEILEQYGVREETNGLEALSVRQMFSVRKFILELTRSYREIQGYNITSITDVPITTSGLFDERMNPKLAAEQLLAVNGDIVVSFNKDLARIWDNGGDRFLNLDRFNYFAEDVLKGRLTLSNRSNRRLEGVYEVELREGDRVIFAHRDRLAFPRQHVEQLAQLAIPLPRTERAIRCELAVRLSYEGGEYANAWDIWVYPNERTKREIHVFDPSGGLRGIESLFCVRRLRAYAEIAELHEGDLLLTTAFDAGVQDAAERGLRVIAYQKGEGFFPVVFNPFYREGVKAILDHPVSDQLAHLGYAGLQFFGVGTDRYFDKSAMEQLVGRYTPIIRRYDARKFTVGDYLLTYRCGRGRVTATTLNLDGGQGSQPHSFRHNPFAVWLLHALICDLSQDA